MLLRSIGTCLLLIGLWLVVMPRAVPEQPGLARAAGVTVNSTEDAVDAAPGDGICETAPGNAVCTLRAAIQEANALPGPDTFILPAGVYTLHIPGPDEDEAVTGDLDITDDLIIIGAGALTTIIDGAGIDRVFHIHRAVSAQISGVTIRNGVQDFGGGIYNRGTLVLAKSIVIRNAASEGGGIENEGALTADSSVIRENEAGASGGGIGNRGTLTVTSTTISHNEAGFGGGGIASFGEGGVATLVAVTISSNTTYGGGGIANGGEMMLTNSTISGNEASAFGGGITNVGTMMVVNSTVSGNAARESGGIHNLSGILVGVEGALRLKNTIVAGNHRGSDCGGRSSIISAGHNLSSDRSCGFTRAGDRGNTDPRLGLLQDNGGPTFTHALLADSPAIDAGDTIDCPRADQRGISRPQGKACDIGAYEFQGLPRARLWDKEEEHIPLIPPSGGR